MKKKTKTGSEESRPLLVLSTAHAAGLGGVILFFLCVMFYIGTIVGRGNVKVNLNKDLLALEIAGLTDTQNKMNADDMAKALDQSSEFVFYKALKTETKPKRTVKPKPATPKKPKTKQVVKAHKKPDKPKTGYTDTVKPPPKPPAMENPVPKPKDISIYKYTIQAASLRTASDAKKIADTLKQKGYQVYTTKALVRDDVWYRVRVGAFKDRMDAKNTLSRLKKDNIDGFLVRRQEKS